jgi:hypothetical protein
MMNEASLVVPSVATIQANTPSADLPPPSDANVPSPTAEQAQISDRVFTTPDHATALLGILTSAMLLRDIAVDTFDTSGEEDDPQEQPDPDKDEDKAK